MTDKRNNREGIYERSIVRDGRRVKVYDAAFEAPRVGGKRKKVMRRGFRTQREAIAWRNE